MWRWYWDIRRDATITYTELDGFQRLTGTAMTPWEIETIRAMDAVLSRHMAMRLKEKHGA